MNLVACGTNVVSCCCVYDRWDFLHCLNSEQAPKPTVSERSVNDEQTQSDRHTNDRPTVSEFVCDKQLGIVRDLPNYFMKNDTNIFNIML